MTTLLQRGVLCPIAHCNAFNRICNVIFGDTGDFLSAIQRDVNASGSPDDPITHRAQTIQEAVEESHIFDALSTVIPDPPGGWPYQGVTLAEAQAAVVAVTTPDGGGAMITLQPMDTTIARRCLDTLLGTFELKMVQYPPEEE
jgi:hypothetical protein